MVFLRPLAALLLLASREAFSFTSLSQEEEFLASYSFERFMREHGVSYDDPTEAQRRKAIFQRNVDRIIQHNKQYYDKSSKVRYKLGVTQFMDREHGELPLGYDKSMHSAWQPRSTTARTRKLQKKVGLPESIWNVAKNIRSNPSSIPDSVDWRARPNTVTSIKNQGGCGSCWAFASTTALESHIAIQTGTLFPLSVQELVSCVPNPRNCGGTGGCGGSTAEIAYDFIASHGMVDEWRFGYQSFHGESVSCKILNSTETSISQNLCGTKIPGSVASIVGFASLPSNDYDVLMAAVAVMGPIAISVAASSMSLYRGGVFDDSASEKRDINHLVVLEGYGTDEETGDDFWLVRNSWGPLWGESGYIRLKRVDPQTLEDPDSDCKMDDTAADGVACTKDDDGNDIIPPPVKVCGTSGILFDSVVPIGGHLMQ